jgi:hypothetical protein
MAAGLGETLHSWHDYFLLIGTASATLVGLIFIAASIGSSIFSERHRPGMQAFITPTVVHFSAVLVIALIVLVPTHSGPTLGAMLGLVGLVGLAYAAAISLRIARRLVGASIEMVDRIWYALIPVLGHLLVLAAAILIAVRPDAVSFDLLAAALAILLLAGIRNAWDMTLWIVERSPTVAPPDGDARRR